MPESRTIQIFIVLFILGLALRLALLPFLGTTDHQIWKIWSYAGATHPLTEIYRLQDDAKPPLTLSNINLGLQGNFRPAKWTFHGTSDYLDYPPVLPWIMGLLGKVYIRFSPVFKDNGTLNALVKLPSLAADIITTLVVFFTALRWRGKRTALLAASFYWLNPMAILGGSLLAYQDPVYVMPLVVCALLLASGRHAWAWIAFAFALLIKPQPLVAAPVPLLASIARRSLPRLVGYVSSAASLGLIFVLPFVLGGTFVNFLANFLRNATETYLSAYNCNLWWLATYARQVRLLADHGTELTKALQTTTEYTFSPRLIAAGLPDPRPWALGLFVVFTVVVLVTWWVRFGNTNAARDGRSPAVSEALALLLYGATMLLTQVHENHAYGAAALLVAAWWVNTPGEKREPDRELFAIACALCLVVSLNMMLFYGLGQDIGLTVIPRGILGIDLTVLLSVANLALFGWWLYRWIKPLPIFQRAARVDRRRL